MNIVFGLAIKYFEYSVKISTNVESTNKVEFPAVTFCNLNPFDRNKSQNYIDNVLQENQIEHVKNITLIDRNPKFISELIKANIADEYFKNNLTSKQVRDLGFDIDYMMLSCLYDNKPCNSSDFVWRYDFDYTNCYTFNSGYDQDGNTVPIKYINEAGSDKSLRLELFLGDDYKQTQFILNSGIRLIIHNQSINPIPLSDGFDIATGFQTNIGITRSFLVKLDAPYSKCIKNSRSKFSFNSKYYRAIFEDLKQKEYRKKFCSRLCLQDFVFKKCKCLDGSLPNIYRNQSICNVPNSIECIYDAHEDFYTEVNDDVECKDCPNECDEMSFHYTYSNSRYPTNYYYEYIRNQTDILSKFYGNGRIRENNITKSLLILNLFYDELDYKIVTQVPSLTLGTLMNEIGGNLCLFVGISLLSMVELIELFLQYVFHKCR